MTTRRFEHVLHLYFPHEVNVLVKHLSDQVLQLLLIAKT